jgi:acetamidase/formamidase|tara:strand:+ start:9258 stop:9551 length:294 start_codon:yes stop_codon:yes gene_type:complete
MSFKKEDWDELMLELIEEECLLADGFEIALVGISAGINPVAVYDVNKMVNVLKQRDEMTHEEALEYLSFNVISAYVGEKTPIFINLDFMRACAFQNQ